LLGGAEARRSWEEWHARVRNPRDAFGARGSYRRLGPLLGAACGSGGLSVEDPKFLTALRAASAREELRHRALRRITAEVLQELGTSGVEAVVLGGLALAELDYPHAALRHTHDVDLLVRDVGTGADALRAGGLRVRRPRQDGSLVVWHESGVPVSLHSSAFGWPAGEEDGSWERVHTRSLPLGGGSAHALDEADTLVAACMHGIRCGPGSLVWAADAYFTIARGLDWERISACTPLAVPLLVTLSYLASALEAPVPTAVTSTLTAQTGAAEGARLAISAGWRAGKRRAARAWRRQARAQRRAQAVTAR
jgi:hypothetical protein